MYPYITICNCKKFLLIETILRNLEEDLNVTRNCFTTCSLIELNKQIGKIHSLCDINNCSVVCSLLWCNIVEILKEHHCESGSEAIFTISVAFKTPTEGTYPTVIKFNYCVELDKDYKH